MKLRKRLCSGALAIGLLTISAAARGQDGPPQKPQDRRDGVTKAPSNRGVLQGLDLSRFKDLQIVEADVPADAPTVVLLDDAARARGRAATHVPEVFVYKNFSAGRNNQTALFFNWATTSGGNDPDCPDGPDCFTPVVTVPGIFHADGAVFGGGFKAGEQAITSYEIFAFRDASDPDTQDVAFVSMELWDGDPLNAFDSTGVGECIGGDNVRRVNRSSIQGTCKTDADCNIADPGLGGVCGVHFTAAPIPGTKVTFSDVPVNTKIVFRGELDPPVVTPHGRVWVVVTSDACRFGWMLSRNSPVVGSDDEERLNALTGSTTGTFEVQLDSDGATNGLGVCCGDDCDGAACDLDGPEGPCCGDPEGIRNMCVDGDAEDATLGTLEGTCSGDPSAPSDNCANFWLNVMARAEITMTLQPTGNGAFGALVPRARIEGNEIIMVAGGENVLMDIQISNFDTTPLTELRCVGGDFPGAPCTEATEVADCGRADPEADPPSFGCGLKMRAWQTEVDSAGYTSGLAGEMTRLRMSCSTDADCVAALGGACAFLGNACFSADDCAVPRETCDGPSCHVGFCEMVFINSKRGDYVFNGLAELAAVRTHSPDFTWGSALNAPAIRPRDPFPARGLNLGQLIMTTSADAAGTFTLNLKPVPLSLLLDAQSGFIDLLGFVPARITVETGQCCDVSVDPGTCLGDQVSVGGCAALGEAIGADVEFNTTKTCADACPRCPVAAPPTKEPIFTAKNRYLSFVSGNPQRETAVQVTFVDLPPPHDVANGRTMWLGPPTVVSESSGRLLPEDAPGVPAFQAASLQCEPFTADWSALGTIHIYHEGIIPGGVYEIREIDATCPLSDPVEVSPALSLTMSRWGDLVGHCVVTPCTPPNGVVGVAFDAVALLDKFSNAPGAVTKARADLEPGLPDQLINITDITRVLDAFGGAPYPFAGPGASDPCSP